LAHLFLWEYSYKGLKLAQVPAQLGGFLTILVVRDTAEPEQS
jgi:hypothetical protein